MMLSEAFGSWSTLDIFFAGSSYPVYTINLGKQLFTSLGGGGGVFGIFSIFAVQPCASYR